VRRAQEVNYLAARGPNQHDLPTIDAILEELLTEDKEPELPQLADNNLAEELLNTDVMG